MDHRIHTGPAHQESVGDPRSGERPGQERHERYGDRLGPMIVAGLVATCGVIEFELGWATRSGKEFEELRASWLRDDEAACSTSVRRMGVESRRARPVQRPLPIMEQPSC